MKAFFQPFTFLLSYFLESLFNRTGSIINISLSPHGENNWSLMLAGMKAYIHQQHQELFWLRMVHTTTACLKSCLQDFQNPCIIRFSCWLEYLVEWFYTINVKHFSDICCKLFPVSQNRPWRRFPNSWGQISYLGQLQRLDCFVVHVFIQTQKRQSFTLLSQFWCLLYPL